jgi:hypothetical protein
MPTSDGRKCGGRVGATMAVLDSTVCKLVNLNKIHSYVLFLIQKLFVILRMLPRPLCCVCGVFYATCQRWKIATVSDASDALAGSERS